MAEACPKCGAAEREAGGVDEGSEDRLWECGRLHRVIDGRVWDMIETEECRRRQLAQRDERIKELEGERDQLRADIATVAPLVRAAMEQEDHHSDAARHYPRDPRDLCACGVCVQVRSLPAAVLERMGVDR